MVIFVFFLDICHTNDKLPTLKSISKMKKSLMTLGVLALFVLMAYGQEKKFALYSVAFYNMENFI